MRFFLNDLCEIWTRNGVNSVALVHRQKVIGCKLLKGLVPGAGVEPARPFGQRILSPFEGILTDLPNEMNQYLPDVQPSKSCFVRLGLATECRHSRVISVLNERYFLG